MTNFQTRLAAFYYIRDNGSPEEMEALLREWEELDRLVLQTNDPMGLSEDIFSYKNRIRNCAQILIEEIGSVGPENLEDTVQRAVKTIQYLKNKNNRTGSVFEDPEDYNERLKRVQCDPYDLSKIKR